MIAVFWNKQYREPFAVKVGDGHDPILEKQV